MDSIFSFTLIFLAVGRLNISIAQDAKFSVSFLDLLIRNYSFQSYDKHFKTGSFHTVHLPAKFSGIQVDTARFRCGSLRRYGAQAKEFRLSTGVIIQPCIERVMLVTQNLGFSWSNMFYTNYNLSGYNLLSPVLGLLAYKSGADVNFSYPFEVGLQAEENPIVVNFTNITKLTSNSTLSRTFCAIFGKNGNITLEKQAAPYICVTKKQGHFGLVVEKGPHVEASPPPETRKKARLSRWKVVVGSMVGAALGASLLGLLLVAIFVKVKKKEKSRMEEMERRAYEEEALQVSMVGHIRARTANATRTVPTIEHEYSPFGS